MKSSIQNDFDFDYWSRLYQDSPEEFENKRKELIQNLIQNCYNQRKLKGMQFRLDMERKLKKHPMGSCLSFSNLMFESFFSEFLPKINTFSKKLK